MAIFKVRQSHYGFAFFLWLALIFWSASQPGTNQPPMFHGIDKIQHFVAYGVLSFLLAKAVYRKFDFSRLVVIVLVIALIGVCDELYQGTVVNRDSSVNDVIADSIGALGGYIVAWLWQIKSIRGSDSE